jgi:trk system potassium uptake protein TrkH
MEFHTKIVLVTSLVLCLGGAILFYIFEYNEAFAEFTWYQKIMTALFQSVTTRTAGFATVPMDSLSDSGCLLTMALMLIGGSPGSTAGGIKTTTIAVLALSAWASSRKVSQPTAFKRCIDDQTVHQAGSVAGVYIAAIFAATLFICAVEPYPLKDAMFEVVSAIGTVGLSTGITSHLDTAARIILTLYMYAGRIGGLSIAIILSEKRTKVPTTRPVGKLLIG